MFECNSCSKQSASPNFTGPSPLAVVNILTGLKNLKANQWTCCVSVWLILKVQSWLWSAHGNHSVLRFASPSPISPLTPSLYDLFTSLVFSNLNVFSIFGFFGLPEILIVCFSDIVHRMSLLNVGSSSNTFVVIQNMFSIIYTFVVNITNHFLLTVVASLLLNRGA